MSYFDDDEQKLKDQAREKGIGYTKNITGGYDFKQSVTDQYGNSGRYEYGGQVYRTREERDRERWIDHM